jgi:folate-binding Fe-S cluster repair protein YgfZ
MEHRGTARKRIVPVEGEAELPAPGTSVEADGTVIGALGSVSGNTALALVRLDRAELAVTGGKQITAGGVRLKLRRPSFARFAVPTVGAVA